MPSGRSPTSVTSTTQPESSSMNESRGVGYEGSSGTYAPPTASTASIDTSRRGVRSSMMPTREPTPTPWAASTSASRSASVSSRW